MVGGAHVRGSPRNRSGLRAVGATPARPRRSPRGRGGARVRPGRSPRAERPACGRRDTRGAEASPTAFSRAVAMLTRCAPATIAAGVAMMPGPEQYATERSDWIRRGHG